MDKEELDKIEKAYNECFTDIEYTVEEKLEKRRKKQEAFRKVEEEDRAAQRAYFKARNISPRKLPLR